MNSKQLLKRLAFLNWINGKIKCLQLKRTRVRLFNYYTTMVAATGYQYSESQVIDEFIQRRRHCRDHDLPAQDGKLRVFWLGTCQSQDESGFLQGLQRLAKVTIFYNSQGNYGIWDGSSDQRKLTFTEVRLANDAALIAQISQAHQETGIDLLLGQMWASLISKEALNKVQAMGIAVINIAMDDRLPIHWSSRDGIRLGSIGLAPATDMVLTTSPETCLWYGVEGYAALYWPLASDPELFAPEPAGVRDIDVLFIGNRYGVRGQIVDYLQQHGIQVDCYGNGWPNGFINAGQNATLSKRARIILGVGTVGHCPDVYTLKLRDFDALMTGALYITHRNPDLCRLFKEGIEFECYTSKQEALEKTRYYLENDAARERIGLSGQKAAIMRDSWSLRLGLTFRQLGLLQPSMGSVRAAE